MVIAEEVKVRLDLIYLAHSVSSGALDRCHAWRGAAVRSRTDGRSESGSQHRGSRERGKNRFRFSAFLAMPPRAGQAIALLLLIPLATSLALSFPLLVVLSFTPILGILALSLLLPLSLSLAYLITTILHLLFAPPHTPLSVSFLRQIKVSFYFLSKIRDAFKARLVESAFEYLVQRLVFLRDKGSYTTLKENIIYNPNSSSLPQLLDIYLPPPLKQSSGVSTTSERSTVGVPVIIYLGGGGYRFWTKRAGAQLGRRWAKMGYIVVVPDIRQYAEGNGVTIDEMVSFIPRLHIFISPSTDFSSRSINRWSILEMCSSLLGRISSDWRMAIRRKSTSSFVFRSYL